MNRDNKILVLGSSGLLGSSIVRQLLKEEYNLLFCPSSSDVNLLDKDDIERYLSFVNVDYIFMTAGLVGGIMGNLKRGADFLYQNTTMILNLLEGIKKHSPKAKLLYTGSTCIYPKENPQPINENRLLSGYLEETNIGYAIAKITGVIGCQLYRQQYGINAISVMPTNMYGQCFSSDTDVMTPDGIKNIKECIIGDNIYTLNPETNEVEIEKILSTQQKKTNEIFNFKSRGCDFRVTGDHKMYYKYHNEFVKKEANYFRNKAGKEYGQMILASHKPIVKGEIFNINIMNYKDEHHIIRDCDNFMKDGKHSRYKYYPTKYDLLDFCKFLGWYISEGSIVNGMKTKYLKLDCGQISISQNKLINPENYNEIDGLLKRMEVNYSKDNERFYFTSRSIKTFIRKEIGVGSVNKSIPKFVFNLPIEYREAIFDTLMKGDGNKTMARYTTKSTQLKNDFVLLCFTLSKKTNSVYKDGVWRISLRKVLNNVCVKYKNISIEDVHNENVFCITTEKNHIIYAGRNNKFNWVGQCDNYDLENGHMLPSLIKKFVDAKRNNTPLTFWGTGNPRRESLYVDDCAEAIVYLMNNYNEPEIVNIGTGFDYSIKELVDILQEELDYKNDINWDLSKPDGTFEKRTDITLLKSLMPTFNPRSFRDGLKIVLEKDFS